MNSKHTVLLETSIQLDRLMGTVAEQRAIEAHLTLADHHFVSSAYVYMEFQRALLADHVRVYHAILHHNNWNDVAHALRSGVLSHRPRALGRCLHILTHTVLASQLDPTVALAVLQTQIQDELPKRFWRRLQPITDSITCDLIATGVTLQSNQQFTIADRCRKEDATCRLPDFLADHRTELQAIAAYLAAHPQAMKGQARLEQLLHTVMGDPRAALGQTSCWPLGDVIIALQALPNTPDLDNRRRFSAAGRSVGVGIVCTGNERVTARGWNEGSSHRAHDGPLPVAPVSSTPQHRSSHPPT